MTDVRNLLLYGFLCWNSPETVPRSCVELRKVRAMLRSGASPWSPPLLCLGRTTAGQQPRPVTPDVKALCAFSSPAPSTIAHQSPSQHFQLFPKAKEPAGGQPQCPPHSGPSPGCARAVPPPLPTVGEGMDARLGEKNKCARR